MCTRLQRLGDGVVQTLRQWCLPDRLLPLPPPPYRQGCTDLGPGDARRQCAHRRGTSGNRRLLRTTADETTIRGGDRRLVDPDGYLLHRLQQSQFMVPVRSVGLLRGNIYGPTAEGASSYYPRDLRSDRRRDVPDVSIRRRLLSPCRRIRPALRGAVETWRMGGAGCPGYSGPPWGRHLYGIVPGVEGQLLPACFRHLRSSGIR